MANGYDGKLVTKNGGMCFENVYRIYFIIKFRSKIHGRKKHKIHLSTIFQDKTGQFRTPGCDTGLDEFGKAYCSYMTSLGSFAEKGERHKLRLIVTDMVGEYFEEITRKNRNQYNHQRFIDNSMRKDHEMRVVLKAGQHLDVY